MRGWLHGSLGFALGIAAVLLIETRPMGRSEWRVEDQIAELQAEIRRQQDLIRRQEDQVRRNEAELQRLRAAAEGK